jgi:HlyD family secretion protein
MKRLLFWTVGIVLLAGVVTGTRATLSNLQPRGPVVPTAEVKRGQVDTSVQVTGELKATRSELLTAPASGAQLRILHLAQTGTPVKKGDLIVGFDPSDQEYQVEEQKSMLLEANLEIEKLLADNAAQKAQDDVDLLTAKFDVRKAELDVQANEIVTPIQARKNALTLEEAKRRLAQLEEDVSSRAKSNDAALAVAEEKRHKAKITIDQAQRLLDQMELRATMDGVVAVRENRETNFMFWGMTFAEYRQGDTVGPGRLVAEVLDLSQIDLAAKVPESERARIQKGQPATVKLDSVGNESLTAHATLVGGIGANRFFGPSQGPIRQFDVTFKLDKVPPSLRPGLTAQVTISGDPLKDVLYIPRQALFDREGKTTVYLKAGERFEPKEVKVVARTASTVVVDKIAEGALVALADPTDKGAVAPGAPSAAPTRMLGTR